jgi:hypothetical protein
MPAFESVSSFLRGSFRSLWALELLLHLKRTRERTWSTDELVEELRGSALIVDQSLEGLMHAGLVSIDSEGRASFQPATNELDRLTEAAEELYSRRPGTARRIIVSGSPT